MGDPLEGAGWSEDDSAAFIELGASFTPARELQHEIVCRLLDGAPPPARLVELCCGAGDLARAVLGRFPHARLLALDGSPAMLERTRAACAAAGARLTVRPFDLAATDWRRLEPAPDAVYSSLAVHHLDGEGKRRLFRDISGLLRPGGRFVLADIVMPADAAGLRIAAEDWEAEVARRSRARHGDDRDLQRFRELHWNFFRWPDDPVDRPSSVAEHLSWLAQAGFEAVDLHWMLAGHAIFSARRPAG